MVLNQQPQHEEKQSPQSTVFEDIHLKDYLWVIRKRIAFVIIPALLALAIGIFLAVRQVPEYSAVTQVLVGRPTAPMMDTQQYSPIAGEDVNTYCEIMRGSSLAQSVVRHLGIQTYEELGFPNHQEGLWKRATAWVKEKVDSSESEVPEPPSRNELAEQLRGSLRVIALRDSRLINITYTCQQRKQAAMIANALAETFIREEVQRRMENVRMVLNYLRKSQREFERNLKKSEEEIIDFQSSKLDAIVVGIDEDAQVQDALSKTVETLTDALAATRVELSRKGAIWTELRQRLEKGESPLSVPAIAEHPLVKDLRARELKMKADLIALQTRYGPRHPKVVGLQKSIDNIVKQMEPTLENVVKAIEYDYGTKKKEAETLARALREAKEEVRRANQGLLEYAQMVRMAETQRDAFDVILQKASETSLVQDVESVNLHITNRAQPDLYRIKSRKGQTIFLAVFLGLACGLGLAFFVDYMDSSIRDPKDVETYLQTNLLGMLELVGDISEDKGLPLPTLEHPKSTVAENFRTLRTNLLFSPTVMESKQMVITSTIPREGKTTVSSNLAVVMAQSGRKVLLIDADMRRPFVHKIFDLSREKGLSTYLIGEHTLDEVIEATNIPGLHTLSAGPIPPNQSELLGSDAFLNLLEEARQEYDMVLIDTPPMSVTDPVIIARMGGGVVLLVVRAARTPRNHVKRVLRDLDQFEIPVAGVLLNQVNARSRSYYRYYYYDYYYYGYGSSEKKGKEKVAAGAKEAENQEKDKT